MTSDAASPLPIPDPPVGVAVIGVGMMGAQHAENLARRVAGARLVGLADPQPGLAERHAAVLGCPRWTLDYQQLLSDRAVEAVVVATPARYHAEAIVAAAQAGKAVFCEKPIGHDLADADLSIAATRRAGVPFQIGFQRRFDPSFVRARRLVDAGDLGRIQLLRSVTRDPRLDEPERVPPGAIFRETLIHDFDVLRFLAGGAEPVEVYAMADALVAPELKSSGLLDTAVVTLRYDSGALATADASFQAVYGYDVRAEVFGSQGMATVGESSPINLVHHSRLGSTRPRLYWFVDLFREAYAAELAHFVAHVRDNVARAGDNVAREVEDAARAGDDVARAGDDVARTGDDVARAGDNAARVGEDATRAGDDVARAGDDVARAGDNAARVGDDVARAGDDVARVGDDVARVGGNARPVDYGQAVPAAAGDDGRAALVIALAALRSVETGRPVRIAEITP